MARISDREPCSDDEAWEHVTDTCERRRIQNRNNQRAFRRRRFNLRQQEQESAKAVRTVWPVILPKKQAQSQEECLLPAPNDTPEPEIHCCDESEHSARSLSLTNTVLRPSLFGLHELTASDLDTDSRRVFHYASTWLWPHLGQKVLGSDESVATAMTRLALSHPLTLDMFVWTAAGELEMHGTNLSTQKVLLKHQMRGIRTIRDGIESNNITDELINAIHALVVMDTPAGELKTWEEMIYGPDPSPFGEFTPPLASLGYLLRLSQMSFSEKHAEIAARLLKARGGLGAMVISEFTYGIQALDLVRTSKNTSSPTFELCKAYKQILETQMPLYRYSNDALSQHKYQVSPEFNLLLVDLRALLYQMDLSTNAISAQVSTETMIAWRNINHHRVLSLPPNEDQIFRLATLIFSYNVTFPVPFRDIVENFTRELVSYLQDAPESSEDLLWATVVASLTQPDDLIQSFLRNKARQLIRTLNITTWFDFKSVVTRYLWLEEACDVGGHKFWNSISGRNDTSREDTDFYPSSYSETVDELDSLDLYDYHRMSLSP